LALGAEDKYNYFIQQQLSYMELINDANLSQAHIKDVLEAQDMSYLETLEDIMSDKQAYIEAQDEYSPKIFTIKKIIKINKRAHNKSAVLRDEIQLKIYRILQNQTQMIKNILSSLDYSDSEQFSKELNDYVVKNQLDNQKYLEKSYLYILESNENSKIFQKIKHNVKEYYAIIDINADVINYIYKFEKRMYRLNKYSKYHLIGIVLAINSHETVKEINPFLEEYGLNVVKLTIILGLIMVIYLVRQVFYLLLNAYLLKIESLKRYSEEILKSIRALLEVTIILININIIIYVYEDFISLDDVAKSFNIMYAILLTTIFYKVLNVIASIKIHEIDARGKTIKNEIINVGIKIINFIIMMVGLLVVLHFAGANLTAVLSGLGIGGFAVALAAKDSLANFFGTLSILLSDVFSQGDWIVIDGNEGVVVEIGLRVTTLRTFDNALVAIPNAILANQDVKNWNKRELGRRIKMNLGIKYDSKSEDIKNTVNEIRNMLDKHPKIATENTKYEYNAVRAAKLVSQDDSHGVKKLLLVYLDEFADSSINILVYCFTKSTDWDEWLVTKEDVMHRIMEIFERNNIEFAFPSMSIYNEK
jgi:MscS family membrane protein